MFFESVVIFFKYANFLFFVNIFSKIIENFKFMNYFSKIRELFEIQDFFSKIHELKYVFKIDEIFSLKIVTILLIHGRCDYFFNFTKENHDFFKFVNYLKYMNFFKLMSVLERPSQQSMNFFLVKNIYIFIFSKFSGQLVNQSTG